MDGFSVSAAAVGAANNIEIDTSADHITSDQISDHHKKLLFVDINEFCYSDATPLITWGAGPCIIIVVFSSKLQYGCLGHLAAKGNSRDWRMLLNSIKAMIGEIPVTDNLEICLLAGKAFKRERKSKEEKGLIETLVQYLRAKLKKRYSISSIIDRPHSKNCLDMGDVVYYPRMNKVVVIAQGVLQKYQGEDGRNVITDPIQNNANLKRIRLKAFEIPD